MSKVAVLVDVGFVKTAFTQGHIKANFKPEPVYKFAKAFIKPDEDLVRIFFYHAEPFNGKEKLPVTGLLKDFSQTLEYQEKQHFLRDLGRKEFVAIRRGKTVFRGWKLKETVLDKFKENPHYTVTDDDYTFEIQQKGVDIKIGLDVAWISEHNEIEKIILITGDSDFVPAMKFARREGVQIITGQYKPYSASLSEDFREHTDVFRYVEKLRDGSGNFVLR